MKFLFDIFPVILFFGAFKGAESFPQEALALASSFMGDGVTATTAPVFIATVTAIVATILQVLWLKIKGAKVETMLWISLAVIVVFGGLTLWLKNEMFIKWKPTILYWIFAGVLAYGAPLWWSNENLANPSAEKLTGSPLLRNNFSSILSHALCLWSTPSI